jgi:hypothetical protein
MKKRLEPELQKALAQNRLLIISPFSVDVKRASKKTAQLRNRMMIEMTEKITIGFMSKGGLLEKLVSETDKEIKKL